MMYSIEQRDDQIRGTQAAIRYHCYFDDAARAPYTHSHGS